MRLAIPLPAIGLEPRNESLCILMSCRNNDAVVSSEIQMPGGTFLPYGVSICLNS